MEGLSREWTDSCEKFKNILFEIGMQYEHALAFSIQRSNFHATYILTHTIYLLMTLFTAKM